MNLHPQRVGEYSVRIRGTTSITGQHSVTGDGGPATDSMGWGKRRVGVDPEDTDRFVWTSERCRLTIWLDAGEWLIEHSAPNPLLGPLIVSEVRHRQAKQAVWDVLTRVTKATRDNEEGVRVASSAARWMRRIGEARAVSYCD